MIFLTAHYVIFLTAHHVIFLIVDHVIFLIVDHVIFERRMRGKFMTLSGLMLRTHFWTSLHRKLHNSACIY